MLGDASAFGKGSWIITHARNGRLPTRARFPEHTEALGAFERETTGAGEELLRITRTGYDEGELGILQLLDAYRIDRQTALRRVDLQFAVKEIEIELSRNAGYEVTQ